MGCPGQTQTNKNPRSKPEVLFQPKSVTSAGRPVRASGSAADSADQASVGCRLAVGRTFDRFDSVGGYSL
jgi:hypothetical protein